MEQVRREDPAAYEKFRASLTYVAESFLARLGYCVGPLGGTLDENSKTALRLYEKRSKIPVTGNPLSFETQKQILSDLQKIDNKPVPLKFLHLYADDWDQGFVAAQGTWTVVGKKVAHPEQTSKIECYRSRGICIEGSATLFSGSSRNLRANSTSGRLSAGTSTNWSQNR